MAAEQAVPQAASAVLPLVVAEPMVVVEIAMEQPSPAVTAVRESLRLSPESMSLTEVAGAAGSMAGAPSRKDCQVPVGAEAEVPEARNRFQERAVTV